MPGTRRLRRDAAENSERLLAAAARAVLAEGRSVPLDRIAAAAGVGIGTLYRHFPDRAALMDALAVRAYRLILAEAEDALAAGATGHDAVRRFLEQAFVHREELVLPLHGAPVPAGPESTALAARMRETMTAIVARGHADCSVRPDVTAGTVVRFGAMLARPMSNVPDWPGAAAEQREVFLRGIAPASAVVSREPSPRAAR